MRATIHVGETQQTAEFHVRTDVTISPSSSRLTRRSAAERSGKAERDRDLDPQIWGH